MEEKKLTDEEIVKALEIGSKCCEHNYLEHWELVGVCKNALDLIHRLQDEIQALSGTIHHEKEKQKQKAEIERLEKRNSVLLYEKDAMEAQCIGFQKQVDELTIENENAQKALHNYLQPRKEIEMQAVKDTARDIYRKAEKKAYFKDGGHYDKDRYLLDMTDLKGIVNGYGLEVE